MLLPDFKDPIIGGMVLALMILVGISGIQTWRLALAHTAIAQEQTKVANGAADYAELKADRAAVLTQRDEALRVNVNTGKQLDEQKQAFAAFATAAASRETLANAKARKIDKAPPPPPVTQGSGDAADMNSFVLGLRP